MNPKTALFFHTNNHQCMRCIYLPILEHAGANKHDEWVARLQGQKQFCDRPLPVLYSKVQLLQFDNRKRWCSVGFCTNEMADIGFTERLPAISQNHPRTGWQAISIRGLLKMG